MLRHDADETTSTLSVSGLFVFIGATPSTVWLDGQLAVDKDGFVLREADIPVPQLESVEHSPLLLQTSRPGIFCVGDDRSRSVKRWRRPSARARWQCAWYSIASRLQASRSRNLLAAGSVIRVDARLRCAAELWTGQIGPLYPSTSIRRAARRPATSADRVRGAPSLRAEPNTGARRAARAAARRPV